MRILCVLGALTVVNTVNCTLQYAHKTLNNYVDTDKELTALVS